MTIAPPVNEVEAQPKTVQYNRGLSAMPRAVGDYVYELAFGLDHTAEAGVIEFNNYITGALSQMTSMLQTEIDREALVPYLGQYEQDIAVRWNDAGDLVLTTTNGDFPLDAVSGQTGFFFIRNVGLLAAQFAKNEAGMMTLTFVSTLGEPQPPFVVMRVD
jgi:hypothetical protein